MSRRQLIIECAKRLEVAPSVLAAVIEVETGGRSGFLSSGRPRILYEAHIFSRLTNREFDRSNPMLSSRYWNRSLYLGGYREHTRLTKASALNNDAAHEACSWGLGQIMGFHYMKLGFDSVRAFVDYQSTDEGQIDTFGKFLQSAKLEGPMRKRQWSTIARIYNGPAYAKNRYDEKIAAAWQRLEESGVYPEFGESFLDPGAGTQYVVRSGDSLYKIAHQFAGGDLSQLLALNPEIIDPDRIDVGQKVNIV